MKSILLVKKFLGLVEMTSGLVNASFSLPERQAVKMIFFAPCIHTHTDYTPKLGTFWSFGSLVTYGRLKLMRGSCTWRFECARHAYYLILSSKS